MRQQGRALVRVRERVRVRTAAAGVRRLHRPEHGHGDRVARLGVPQGSYSNNEIKFKDIPGWIEQNFLDCSDMVCHTSVAINMLSTIYFGVFCGNGAKLMYYN